MKFPDLNEMTDVEAIQWYTSTVNRLMRKGKLREYHQELLDWKQQLNERLEQNRKSGWIDC